jgi:DNA gyrase subunit B
VFDHVHVALRKYFIKHKAKILDLIKRTEDLVELRKKHSHEEDLTKAVKSNRNKLNLPRELTACPHCKPEKRELFIVEGQSALSTAKEARSKDFQEILPLTGKVLNVVRNNDKVISNERIQDILRSIGYDKTDKKMERSRVRGKIIILTDADADGGHIKLLLLALLHKYFRHAFEMGIVYIIDTPLYEYKSPTENAYGNTLKDIREQVKKFDPVCLSRMKGWGGCSAKSLRKIAFGPERELLRVSSLTKAEEPTFDGLLNSDPVMRRKMLKYDPNKELQFNKSSVWQRRKTLKRNAIAA